MIDNRCPSCRWRVLHEQGSGRPQVPCCHGGSPVTIHGDFPFCPEPPYDFCAAWQTKDETKFRVGQAWINDHGERIVVARVEGGMVHVRRSTTGKIIQATEEVLERELSSGWMPVPDAGGGR